MAVEIYQNNVRIFSCLFFLIAFSYILSIGFVNGRRVSNADIAYTIEAEDGDIIDCVDIYKQPAFSHPLLRNHTVQMKPSSSPNGLLERSNTDAELFQDWNKKGKCPKGTIPIARTQNIFNPNPNASLDQVSHEFALGSLQGGYYYGAQARLNLWHPTVMAGEMSSAQIMILGNAEQDRNIIEAGWRVFSGDSKTRIFIYWTTQTTAGCYNLDCPGFVQTNRAIALGGGISPISTYNGKQKTLDITVHKDFKTSNWWLNMQGHELGYWPASILKSLALSASTINWGGEITNLQANGHHTSTQMGSGHFPGEGFQRACVISNLKYIDNIGTLKDPESLISYLTNPSCYDFKVAPKGENGFGVHFYFGGPGYSPQCQ